LSFDPRVPELAVSLDDDLVLRIHEIGPSDEATLVVSDLVLQLGPRETRLDERVQDHCL
jgi:hypothetical protein